MFEKIVNVFRIDELRKKIVTTLILLFVFRIGMQVPIPGISLQAVHRWLAEVEKQGSEAGGAFGNFFNIVGMLSAGGLLQIGVFSLGIMPYISSSIIFQLAGGLVPTVSKMQKEEEGRKKLTQWTRYLAIFIALSTASLPELAKKIRSSPGGVNAAMRVASAKALGCARVKVGV